ncbi:MAG: peptidoglycan editing factor PgeF [Halanaerobiales bacterium]
MFSWVRDQKLAYLQIEKFAEFDIKAYFTSRKGGVSTGKYDSLNLGLHTIDQKEFVLKNRRLIAESIGIEAESFTAAEQIHGDKIYNVQDRDKGSGALDYQNSINGVDALFTDKAEIPLISFYADCVPLYFVEPGRKIIALAHAGWKGTVKKIGKKTILAMENKYDIKAGDVWVAIGPSISRDFYQVDDYVLNKFREAYPDYRDFIVDKGKGQYLLDLWQANIYSLKEVGIEDKHIILSDYCTYSSEEYFYSYRRDNKKTGRMASIIYF